MSPAPVRSDDPGLHGDYPTDPAARTRWILARRGAKNPLDPTRAYASLWEEEMGEEGTPVPTATLFLTNRECPFRCLMCGLWRDTLDTRVPAGAIPQQIAHALENLPPARQIKLYNAGNFFDDNAIPPEDDAVIAEQVRGFERVIVECHPTLLGERCLRFRDRLKGRLEVAVGLETVHPGVLDRLNKRLTVERFQHSAAFLAREGIALRVFLLVRPPFLNEAEGIYWAQRSLEVAFEAGATVCAVIPTRPGNGALEALATTGDFASPRLSSLEAAQEYGLKLNRGRVFSDLWDIERFAECNCAPERIARLETMNRTQTLPPPIPCTLCTPL